MKSTLVFSRCDWLKGLFCSSVLVSSSAMFFLSLKMPEVMASSACPDVSVTLTPVDVLRLPHARIGDTEMDGNHPVITIRATATRQGQSIVVNGKVHMQEGKSDWTTFEKNFVEETPVGELSDPRCEVVGITPVQGTLQANAGDDNHSWTHYSGRRRSLIQSAECLADTKGGDNNDLGCRNIRFAPITIQRRAVAQAEGPRNRSCSIMEMIFKGC